MRKSIAYLIVSAAVVFSSRAMAASPGHVECAQQFKRLSKGRVTVVPEVKDWGDEREYYFAWNHGSKSKPIQTKSGTATGACVINKATGEGFVTLNSKDLGDFKAALPEHSPK
jgi:hypothetical protein